MLKVLISDLLKKTLLKFEINAKLKFFLQKTGFLKNQCNLTACSLLTFFVVSSFAKITSQQKSFKNLVALSR